VLVVASLGVGLSLLLNHLPAPAAAPKNYALAPYFSLEKFSLTIESI